MRWLLASFALLGLMTAARAETFVYISKAPEKQIQVFRLDDKTGKLTAVQSLDVDGAPGALGVDPDRKHLYASLRTASTLAGYKIDPKTGKLTPINSISLGKGNNAAFVGTDRSGRWLLSASYSGGKVFVHRLKEDGSIEEPAVQAVRTTTTAHNTTPGPENGFVFVPHVAPNAVYQFRFDAKTGKLTDAGKAAGGADKAGPRHIAFHPKLPFAFTSDESGSSITAYRFDPKSGLKPVQTLSTLPKDFTARNSTAEVKVHPSGKFVWVSNRGHDSLAGFAIDKNGKLTSLGQTPTEKTPRSFAVTPSGRHVLGAGQGTGKLAVYSVDLETGKLKRVHTVDVGKSLAWVEAVEVGK